MNKQNIISKLQQFCEKLYQLFETRTDALLDLLNTLPSNPNASLVLVQLVTVQFWVTCALTERQGCL